LEAVVTYLINVPGINGSDAVHWQSRWEERSLQPGSPDDPFATATFGRIAPSSWDEPDLADWLAAIDRVVDAAGPGFYFVAHSLGCHAVAEWLTHASERSGSRSGGCAGAFLVAPPDTTAATFPEEAASFRPAVRTELGVPALLLSSADDPYCSPSRAAAMAADWAAEHHDVGSHGHLNSASGLGDWLDGERLLGGFAATLQHPTL
jgi:predicted alpha/beta hydrolase family esterase